MVVVVACISSSSSRSSNSSQYQSVMLSFSLSPYYRRQIIAYMNTYFCSVSFRKILNWGNHAYANQIIIKIVFWCGFDWFYVNKWKYSIYVAFILFSYTTRSHSHFHFTIEMRIIRTRFHLYCRWNLCVCVHSLDRHPNINIQYIQWQWEGANI